MSRPLEPSFVHSCTILKDLHALPKRDRARLEDTVMRFEDAAISLLEAQEAREHRASWLRHAAFSGSLRLVQAFDPAPLNSVEMPGTRAGWLDLGKSLDAPFLRALRHAGLRLKGLHETLVLRAARRDEPELQDFLVETVDDLWHNFKWLEQLGPDKLSRQPDFLTRYLTAAVAAHPQHASERYGIAARSLNAVPLVLLEILGVEPRPGDMIPDRVIHAERRLSNHERLQVAAWKRNLSTLLADRAALDWLKTRYFAA